jgi:glutathione S-transferase
MVTLYHAPKSRSSRFIWLLEELGIPYRIRPVSIFRPMQGIGAPDPANPHPDKRVPAIEHDGSLVAESVAIALHLADAFPEAGLAPISASPLRGPYLTWLAWYGAEMEPSMLAMMGNELENSAQKRRNYDAVLLRLETALAQGHYLLGESFSAADVLVSSALNFMRSAFPASAALDAYALRCRSRPAALAASLKDEAEGVQQAA